MTEAPSHLLERAVSQRVTLRLKDTRSLAGQLLGLDEHLNLVLDDASETTAEVTRHLGRVVVRGSNIVSVNAAQATLRKTP